MEDGLSIQKQTPTSAWLTFSLAFADSTRLCRLLRQSCPDPGAIGDLIQRYLTRQDEVLAQHLRQINVPVSLQELFSEATIRRCEQALTWQAQRPDHHLLGMDHQAYPALLQDTDDAPPLLYARGSLQALDYPLIAVVGSRKASHSALSHTRTLCTELAEKGLGIVSGLAIGVDAAAHQGALAANGPHRGPTLAIAATPPERVYPKRHHELAEQIIEAEGLIITEYPHGSVTRPWHFPQRNRIISGLSLGVLVAEAGLPSGTLTTATHAMNQGREVMAVPGSIHNLQARGCHALIKQGAALVENYDDIIDILGEPLQRALAALHTHHPLTSSVTSQSIDAPQQHELALSREQPDSESQALLSTLASQSATIDELMTHSHLSVSQLAALLGLLEAKGLIRTSAGGRYALCQP
ncbi:DNA-processing protein DprA [Granulosicoccus antarcticus]|uniref:Uncharacterized protein n=1 Tax=Granulosicoccus antarcticus IMCC3135 TaxID=1192854 RepID=A0A2Z2NNE9_9GAMM|nr:DNA-processing protein DprA [Granulosicoccus antarcticus]ASJ71461.1 hypothetical protein IMCC3135_06770 [Granulosicoccus antarcticus IMCC3135]